MYFLTSLLFFGIPLLYYINFLRFFDLKSSIIFCLSSGDIYFSLIIYSLLVSKLLFRKVFEALVILSAFLFPMKSSVSSAVFLITVFDAALSAFLADCLACLAVFTTKMFAYIFANILTHVFSKRQKFITFNKYSVSLLN